MATLVLPALLGLLLSLLTGREDWIVLIGVYLLLGVALDAGLYAWLLRYQPPWMTFVLALGELGLLYVLARVLKLDLTSAEAIGFYWAAWLLAIFTKVVLLPIFSLTYLESSLEFRRIDWSIPPAQAPLPVLAAGDEAARGLGPLMRSASGEHAVPLKPLPGPSEVFAVPAEMRR